MNMIEVQHLTKKFPGVLAVDDVSFDVKQGEIIGFLGPNGAGKTTIMRILSGYIPATGGHVLIGGLDVFKASLAVRKRIGYLPESVPLYLEMRVNEYLRFRARLKGVPARQVRGRVDAVKERCGLTDAGRRIIGGLSKGYRQRVGLADALVHEPDVLILDEPTVGLDPNQIRHVRELIKTLAEQHTVLLSTHILSEAEMICPRVLIINDGRIIASGAPKELTRSLRGGMGVVTEIYGPAAEVTGALSSLPSVEQVEALPGEPWTRYILTCTAGIDLRQNVFELVVRQGWRLRELRLKRSTLEDVFVNLTGKQENVTEAL